MDPQRDEQERLEAAKAEQLRRYGEKARKMRDLAAKVPPPPEDAERLGPWAAERTEDQPKDD